MTRIARNAAIVTVTHLPLGGALLMPAGTAPLVAAWGAAQIVLVAELLRPRSRLFGANVWTGTAQPRVALTFDDGPHPEDTPAILDRLERAGARATFFFVGARARAHPDLVRRVARAGHGIGVHSDTHPWWFSLAPRGRVRREVAVAARTLEELAGRRPRFFRPPMGHKNLFLDDELSVAGLRMATWSVRAFDTLGRSAPAIRDAVLDKVRPGGIVLLHEAARRRPGRAAPAVEALPEIIEGLRARGLVPVSLEDLLPDPPRAGRSAPEDRPVAGTAAGTG